jgi:TolA-binding protein
MNSHHSFFVEIVSSQTKKYLNMLYRFFLLIFAVIFLLPMHAHAQKSLADWNPQQSFQEGKEFFKNKQFGAAQKLFAQLIGDLDDPNSQLFISSRFYEAASSYYLGEDDAAVLITRFADDYPGSSWMSVVSFFKGSLLFDDRKYEEAIIAFENTDHHRLTPDQQHEMNYKMAYALLQNEEIDKALVLFEKVYDENGRYSNDAAYYKAHIHYLRNEDEQALKLFNSIANDRTYRKQIPLYVLQIRYRNGELDEVLKLGEEAYKEADYRRKPEIAKMLADAWYAEGDYEKALQYYEVYERQNRRKLGREDHYQIGVSKMNAGQMQAAIRNFEQVGPPDDSLQQYASYNLAACYVETGQTKFAKNAFLAAYKAGYDNQISEDALFNYAKLSLAAGADPFSEAAKLLQEFIALHPDSERIEEAERLVIHLYLAAKDYDKALARLEKLGSRDPEMLEIYDQLSYSLAIQLFNQGEIQQAAEYFSRIAQQSKQPLRRAEATYWLAETFYYQKNYWGAEKYFKEFLGMSQARKLDIFPMASYNLGYNYFSKKDYQAALPSFRQFVASPYLAKPDLQYDAMLRIGDCHFMLKQYQAAIDAYEKVDQASKPGGDYALYQAGLAYGAMGQSNQKIARLEKLIQRYPQSSSYDLALYEIGSTHLVSGDSRSAINSFDRLVREKPRSNFARQALMKTGMIYYNNNQNEQALTSLKQVVNRYPGTNESREALSLLRSIYMEMNNLQAYFKFTEEMGVGQVSSSQQDSLAFVTAEQFYQQQRCDQAAQALDNYFRQFPEGAFLLQAHHYAAQCAIRSGNQQQALNHLVFIIEFADNPYTDESLLAAARIEYDRTGYENAASYYSRLIELTDKSAIKREALEGGMKSNYFNNNYQAAVRLAQLLQQSADILPQQRLEADYILGKSFMAMQQPDKAIAPLQLVIEADQGSYGAEAAYLLAEAHFLMGQYGLAEERIFANADRYPSFEFWLAKGYILLADIYATHDNVFQARETLKSIIDNYSGEDLKAVAREKLEALEKVGD